MGRRSLSLVIVFVAVGLVKVTTASTARAENWPQWRGPSMNGVSAERDLPSAWTKEQNVTWKLSMPDRSGATPIIWGDIIFLNVAEADKDTLSLWAIDRTKGEPLWKKPLGGGNHMMRKQNMSSPSPVTDGKAVYVMTGNGILKAFDFKGAELWTRDIQKDYGQFGLNWGYASSPLLYEGSLFVQVLHGMKTDDPSYILRIDTKTGKSLWRVERPTTAISESPDSYTTPAVIKIGTGKTWELVITGGDAVTGHDPATGAELWRSTGLNPENNPYHRIVASPFVIDGLIYAPSRVKMMLALKPGGRGDVTATHRAWAFDRGPDVPTPVSDGKYVYIVDDRGVMHCLDAKTGTVIYGPQRLKSGTYSSSPVLADGKLYIGNEDGLVQIVKAGPAFELVAENAFDEYMLSSPAISDGQVFIRTAAYLYCIGKRTPAATKKSSE
jgi:outer membrane protein assembly factor BamB